jgi:hypothetical protein
MVSFSINRFPAALLLGGSLFLLSGCDKGESSDKTPPDYTIAKLEKALGKYRYGVTDTITVDFSEKIDTSALSLTLTPPQGIETRLASQTRLLIYGKNKSSGASHFTVNSPFTATMAGLKDLDGNGRTLATESFQPYWWADKDFTDTTFTGFDSLFLDSLTWADGSPLTDSLVAEGSLDYNNNFGREDRQDFKIIRLVPPDTFKVIATCSKTVNLRMQIAGPFPPDKLDSVLASYNFNSSFYSDSTKNKGTLTFQFSADYSKHDIALGGASNPGIYAIRLSIPPDQEGFYRLGLTIRKLKRP